MLKATWHRKDMGEMGEIESYAAHFKGCALRIWQLTSWYWSAVYLGDPPAPDGMTDVATGIERDSADAAIAAEIWADAYRPKG